jgi:alpha-1,6-mannosyltransferase
MKQPASFDRVAPLATNLALLVLGLGFLQLCRDGVREYHHYIHGYSMDVLLQIALYAAGFLLALFARTNRWTLGIILGVALAARLVGVFTPEFLSSDIYRYVWDGKVQAAGINPYRYIPADEHLRFLRDEQIYPHINRKTYAHTIYPPGGQLLFLAITRIGATEACMKAAMVAFEALAVWALLQILSMQGRRREEILLYAWHPLCVWEIGSSGHLDAVAVGLLSCAALALLRLRAGQSSLWITLAAMVKLYPAVLLLALGRRLRLSMLAVSALIVAAGYAIYFSVGWGVLGFLGSYSREEGLDSGTRYFLLAVAHRYLHVPMWPPLYIAASAVVLLALAAWSFRRERTARQTLGIALALTTSVTILFSPHYPWYFLWIVPFAVTLRYLPALVLTLSADYWFATSLAIPGPRMFRMNEYMYGTFAAAVAVDLLVRWLRARRHLAVSLPHHIRNRQVPVPASTVEEAYE